MRASNLPTLLAATVAACMACLLLAAQAPVQQSTRPAARMDDPRMQLKLPSSAPTLDLSGPLRVGTCDLPPWSIKPAGANGQWSGIAVHLLREMTAHLNIPVDMREYDYPGLLDALERGEVDVGATGIGITPEHLVRFTMTPAFDQSGISIATHTRPRLTFFGVLKRVSTEQVLVWGVVMAIACVLFGGMLWALERRRNPPFEGNPAHGLVEASWWSVVTMFTVGYGDRVPVTKAGKLVAVIWMVLAFILVTVSSGLVTSVLTVQQLQPVVSGPRDLSTAEVGCVDGTDGQQFLKTADVKAVVFRNYESAVQALANGKLDAVVGSTAALHYLVSRADTGHLLVLPQPIRVDYVGFGMRYGLPDGLEKHLELEMLKVSQSEEFRQWRDALLGQTSGGGD